MSQIRNTNFQNLKELLKNYTPKTVGIAAAEECSLIKDTLQLEDMEILDLRNLRDFVVLYLFKEESLSDIDKMSAITAVIDSEIIEKGGEV